MRDVDIYKDCLFIIFCFCLGQEEKMKFRGNRECRVEINTEPPQKVSNDMSKTLSSVGSSD